jgi:hypothetical protein
MTTTPHGLARAALLIVAVGATACSSRADTFAHSLRQSQSALMAAKAAQAEASPLAALHLHLAQEQLLEAQRLYHAGHPHRAQNLLSRAEADAQLALALVQEVAARAEADELTDRLVDAHSHLKGGARSAEDAPPVGDGEVLP